MTQTPTHRRLVRTAAGFTRKARQHGQATIVSAEDLARIYLAADGRCHYCSIELDPFLATFDHMTPFERGGQNVVNNVVLCCLFDNRAKFTMLEAEYREFQKVERRCRSCDKQFKPRAADYRRGYGWYCSRRCSGKAGGLA